MPRNPKCRRICMEPACREFSAEGSQRRIPISMEEVESLRLCDMEGFSQDEAAAQMNVSRGTLQRILYSARQKTASALVRGHGLSIGGGHYEITPGECGWKRCHSCRGHQIKYHDSLAEPPEKGRLFMKIAVTTENGTVFQHFGKTKAFTLYTAQDGAITEKALLDAGEAGHSALATLLAENSVDVLICGGIGAGAKEALKSCGIQLVAGASGDVDAAAKAFLEGSLVHDDTFQCHHHDHDHGEGHTCGGHGHEHGHDHHCGGHCHG